MTVPARVTIVQQVVPHYRLKLFELLHEGLAACDVRLQVVYGNPNDEQAAKTDLVELPPSYGLRVRNLWLTQRLLHQPVISTLMSSDLTILQNAAGYLPNYLFWLRGHRRRQRLGFWVYHTRQRARDRSLKERISRRMMRAGDCWFAYTAGTRDYLLDNGAHDARITVLHNSVDLQAFGASLERARDAAGLAAFATRHGIATGVPTALFCGGLHRDKRLEFLFEAVRRVQVRLPDFQLIVLGNGRCREVVLRAAAQDRRIRYLGPLFGDDKARCFALSRLYLCPGLVGLGILDAFAAGVPIVTTDLLSHSPEIDYLRHGVNGWMARDDVDDYARAVLGLLTHPMQCDALAEAARTDARAYSIQGMAQRFTQGIARCLQRG